jgi:ABC-2 type transport system ATP-binding protein
LSSPPAATALRIEGLVKIYPGPKPVRALDGLSLEVRRGEILGLLGPNGAGKTTTVGVCTTRVVPTAGRAVVDGLEVRADPAAVKRRVGVVTQHNTLDRACTVAENLYYHCRYFGMGHAASRERTAELLVQFRLGDRADLMPLQLSGGLAQRVQIARAIAHRPAVLFLDEPSAGLDPQSRLALWEVIGDLRNQGITILLTTHYMEEADRLSDRVAIIDHGRVLVVDSPAALKRGLGAATVIAVHTERADEGLRAALARLPEVHEAHLLEGGVRLLAGARDGLLPRIIEATQGYGLRDLSVTEPTLETVFIKYTGRDLRD